MTGVAVPSWTGVAASFVLVLVAIAVAARRRLGLTRELTVAAARSGVQLVAVGALLGWLFTHAGVLGALAWVLAMVLVAGQVAGRRGRGLHGPRASATVGVGVATLTTLGLLELLQVMPSQPRVLVPVGGMVVSSAMQGASLVLRRLREQAVEARPAVEARLALGLSPEESFAPALRSTLRTALVPTVDSTKVVGLISLPGAMTGLILAGVAPLTAIRYQLVVMWMLLAAVAVSALATARVALRGMFDDAARLRPVEEPLPTRAATGSPAARARRRRGGSRRRGPGRSP